MDTIDHFNLRSFDLNLLIAFDALITEGNVTLAARRLKIGQPAMSHNLATLRMLFEDELFLRVGQRMQPTARARRLAGPIRNALNLAQAALSSHGQFDPATESRTFQIHLSAECELLLLPDLVARLRERAPGIRLFSRNFEPVQLGAMLDTGALDMVVGCSYAPQTRHSSEVLYDAEVVCCYNPELLSLTNPVPLEAYLAAGHAVISQSDNLKGCIKELLDVTGIDVNVVTAAPDFMTILLVARTSPVIATVSSRIARRYAPMLGLATSPVPVAFQFPSVTMVWPRHADSDPASRWLREEIRSILLSADTWSDPSRIAA